MRYLIDRSPFLRRLSAPSWHSSVCAAAAAWRVSLLSPLFYVAIWAFTALPAGADEANSSLPFVLPERPRFVVPESKPFVIPESKPFVPPETSPPAVAKEKPGAARKRKSRRNPEADQRGDSDVTQPDAATASMSPSTTSGPSADTPAALPSDAPTSDNTSSAAPTSTPAGKRYTLQGKTEVIDYKLDELDAYKQGMVALEKRDYAGAAILFRAAAAKLDDGYEKYRAQCNFFEAKSLMMTGKADQAVSLLKSAIALFQDHDPRNPYKLTAEKLVADLVSGKARMGNLMLQGQTNLHRARTSIDENITLYSRLAADDSDPHLLQVEKEGVPHTIHDCFAEMTCLETAELGSNVYSAIGRWQPLLVKGEPAAIEFGAKPPVINVKVNGHLKEVSVDLPMVNGLRRILLATDGERVCAMDVDNNDTWLLLMDNYPDGSVGRFRWALLRHQKQKSATWGVSRNKGLLQSPAGDAWGARPAGMRGQGNFVNPYSRNNKRNRY